MPPVSLRIVEKGLASDRVIIETVVAKYADLPLYRQEAMIEREACGDFARDAGRLGDARRRVAGAGSGSDAGRSANRILYTGG
jgi:hypothetical protein